MISKILSLLILVPLAIVLVVFSVANREAIPVSLDPIGSMPQLAFEAPLFILLMGSVIIGVVLGGIGTWLTQAHYRRKSWKRKYEVEKLRRETEENKAKLRQLQEERDRASYGQAASNSTALATSRAA
ncbi:LapA family protein [Aurantimonas sp. C2-6-R+9]|uniref:LapA family protein n=1 Tax=unclassified Aurantimonas TaxID=2638230 RepID=UPI002E18DEE2|nr:MULTISPECIES: LapA family protein [unclassified Aurantimonas]MEC5289539.1 LapA family protein [Aurantimonas sp. C2-3-R2]MEC5323173.1 LapA family protein [Aurantimonas sp. A3-2-R12]MEC5379504.1 LapA family protein [Aurantimonas sp. C2-6-R+9]MEC5410620.1 LapA family protein [Aurantimonas sp. C2-4-R8]